MIKDVIGYEDLYTCDEYGNIFSCITNSSRRKKRLLLCEFNRIIIHNDLYKGGGLKCRKNYNF